MLPHVAQVLRSPVEPLRYREKETVDDQRATREEEEEGEEEEEKEKEEKEEKEDEDEDEDEDDEELVLSTIITALLCWSTEDLVVDQRKASRNLKRRDHDKEEQHVAGTQSRVMVVQR